MTTINQRPIFLTTDRKKLQKQVKSKLRFLNSIQVLLEGSKSSLCYKGRLACDLTPPETYFRYRNKDKYNSNAFLTI